MSIEHIKAAITQLQKAELVELADFLSARIAAADQLSPLTEQRFWGIIHLLDWEQAGQDKAVLAPAANALSQLSGSEIEAFADWQAFLLKQLDTQLHAETFAGDDADLSADGFLYARCAVLANGRKTYYEVLSEPEKMPSNLSFEALLHLPEQAWRLQTKEDNWTYTPAFNYETGFNERGWGKLTVQL